MWLGKTSLKVAALVLVGTVSSVFAQGLAPIQISADDWDYLTNFKLYGQTGISFGNQDEFPEEKGWVADYLMVIDMDVAKISVDAILTSFQSDVDWDAVAACDGTESHDCVPVYHRPQPALDLAANIASTKPLGGTWAWDRHKSLEDISPLVACTMALGAATSVEKTQRSAYDDGADLLIL